MLLIYTQKSTSRIKYIFKHICTQMLGLEISFTNTIESFISYAGPKISYGKKPMGNEFFIQASGLLTGQGLEAIDINVRLWDDTKCFFQVSEKSAIPFDIFSASFFLLSRYEEYLPHVKDAKGRFPFSESLAYKEDFLNKPVVDIWAFKFKRVLLATFPKLIFKSRNFSEHYLVYSPESYKYLQKGFVRSLFGASEEFVKLKWKRLFNRIKVLLVGNDPYNTFSWVIEQSKKTKKDISFLFRLGEAENYQETIITHRKKFKALVKYVSDYKKIGILFSNEGFEDLEVKKKEINEMQTITKRPVVVSINENLKVNLPDYYRELIELEIQTDCTMVYEDVAGFRASTCTPFLFYDLDYEIRTPLTISPVTLNSKALYNKHPSQQQKMLEYFRSQVLQVQGEYILLFNNKDFINIPSNKCWRSIIQDT